MTVAFESGPRARRAYAREDGWDYPEDLNPEFLLQFYEHWGELDEGIKSLQEKKKSMIASVRSWYGRRQAEGVKKAMNLMLMGPHKRFEHIQFNEVACRYVEILQAEIGTAA
ncbi:hypothetical protein VSX64_14790 [Aurantimonas sp. C2-6-R+9]|uniref:hypothetical protein n=1 Tax=Aurantimonas sp. C2-6-R+9 TaxID=3114365 RepID=UPI002E19A8C8|nr:hypothetical protein [Aurantimonas sp. C2-6-R+9]